MEIWMRGKKTDPNFMSEFIRHCVADLGMEKSEDIVLHAKSIIQEIDQEIKNVEKRKLMRSKLLDVVLNFEKPVKDKSQEAKMLDFCKLKYPDTCKELCEHLKMEKLLPAISIRGFGQDAAIWNFCIKQLIEANIIDRVNNDLTCGNRFDEYVRFVDGK